MTSDLPNWRNALVELTMLASVLAFMWSPRLAPAAKKPPAPIPVVAMGENFDTVWNGMQIDTPRARNIPLIESKSVRTERIIVPTAAPVDVSSVSEPLVDKPVVQRRRHVVVYRNICSRHGMRKVMTGRYKWRCRR